MKRLYRNNKINFCGGAKAGFVTFYPFADKNSIVSSYFIVEKRVFCGIYKKKGLDLLWAQQKDEILELRMFSKKCCV